MKLDSKIFCILCHKMFDQRPDTIKISCIFAMIGSFLFSSYSKYFTENIFSSLNSSFGDYVTFFESYGKRENKSSDRFDLLRRKKGIGSRDGSNLYSNDGKLDD